ncbi:predicted protein [Brucella abortus]|uniref:Uncharacterized protein n=1 Tax=Brucella abortus (strain 2308) TaxID=359391 RepID=Q2YL24_BRUA2|nr:conserved hypothetical protein [Brucella abortus 2308]SHO32401.1 predicted protein [Brucella abortus]
MSSELNGHSPRNRARRHFLGVAATAAARVAILGALVSSSLPARHGQQMVAPWGARFALPVERHARHHAEWSCCRGKALRR